MVIESEPSEVPVSKSNEKNRKKKEARKKASEKKLVNEDNTIANATTEAITERLKGANISEQASPADAARRLKNLRKRLAQIDALKAKMESGELANPDPDQVRKVQRREEVLDEIRELELEV